MSQLSAQAFEHALSFGPLGMAEGPQVLATAKALDEVLTGNRVIKIEGLTRSLRNSTLVSELAGQICRSVRTHGKNIFLDFDEAVIHTHLLMFGRWKVYRAEKTFPRKNARLILQTKHHSAVLYGAPLVRVLSLEEMRSDPRISSLGPDAMADPFQKQKILENLEKPKNRRRELGPTLLDQTIVAGIGNIYKSEILFQSRVNPFEKIQELGRPKIEVLIDQIPKTLWFAYRNEFGTVPQEQGVSDFYVYYRAGKLCLVCESRILSRKQEGRITFWCPNCQKGSHYSKPSKASS